MISLFLLLGCSEDDPKYFNSTPQITITSHEAQDTVVVDEPISLQLREVIRTMPSKIWKFNGN